MKILLDHDVPQGLRNDLAAHETMTTAYRGWDALKNGDLLRAAQSEFDVLVTLDRGIPNEQHVSQFDLVIVVLVTHPPILDNLRRLVPILLESVQGLEPRHAYQIDPEHGITRLG